MENFKKLVYKNPELQNNEEKQFSPEQLEYSEKIAKEKLEKILDPNFSDFAVRYMNIEEYKQILETGEIKNEVTVYGGNSPLKENVNNFLNDAHWRVESHTNSEIISGISRNAIWKLTQNIKLIESENKKKNFDQKMELIREQILDYLNTFHRISHINNFVDPKSFFNKMSFLSEQQQKDIRDNFINKIGTSHYVDYDFVDDFTKEKLSEYNLNNKQKNVVKEYLNSLELELKIGKENMQVITDFKNNNEFLKEKNNLRKLITAIGFVFDPFSGQQHRQYHLAVIFDSKTFGLKSSKWIDQWTQFDDNTNEKLSESEKGKGILGAISIIRLKETYKEMIELEKGSGDFAHPVFDSSGTLRWPK